MDFKVIWSDQAVEDLRDLCSYVAHHDPQAALKLGNGILDHVQILGRFPFIGPPYPRGSDGILREIVFRSYRIFDDVREDMHKVDILHVRHGARSEPMF